jgi:hypothetical protein
MSTEPRYKVQRFKQSVGPWVDDICGSWTAPAGTPGRLWVSGMTRAEAEAQVAFVERLRQTSDRAAFIPPRRAVPFDHPCGERP